MALVGGPLAAGRLLPASAVGAGAVAGSGVAAVVVVGNSEIAGPPMASRFNHTMAATVNTVTRSHCARNR
ncbi:Uncharacterised protein [Serratia odorifera]|uniref:Uncharacterized protein n=1 Tax=Serratia odorifera TaxID=618 RepID=A0A3S4DH50_SEROD|nr:Uncharacterised protein [Serratia odorifera]